MPKTTPQKRKSDEEEQLAARRRSVYFIRTMLGLSALSAAIVYALLRVDTGSVFFAIGGAVFYIVIIGQVLLPYLSARVSIHPGAEGWKQALVMVGVGLLAMVLVGLVTVLLVGRLAQIVNG